MVIYFVLLHICLLLFIDTCFIIFLINLNFFLAYFCFVDIDNTCLGQYVNGILKMYHDGLMVLDYYNVHKNLNYSMKNKLSSVIVKHELKNDLKMNKKKFIDLAKGIHLKKLILMIFFFIWLDYILNILGIEKLFPSENEYTYFIPYFKEDDIVTPNRGKLFDKYCNLKKKISKISSNKRNNTEPDVRLNYKGQHFI